MLESKLTEALACISPDMQEIFLRNRERFVMSPYQSDTKVAGAFVANYARLGRHFLSCDLDGGATSLSELFHEVTHLIHNVIADQHQTYYWYRNSPPEISEGLAMGVELIATQAYSLFFNPHFVGPARARALEGAIMDLIEAALNTAYEAELHRHTNSSLSETWIDISNSANLGIHWQKLEAHRRFEYVEKLELL